MTATGVRSSWEASAVNCCSASKDPSNRPNIWLKVSASRENSWSPGGTATRAERSAASLMAAAVAVISSKGRKARWTIPYPPKAARRMKAGRVTTAMNTRLVTVWGFSGASRIPRTHRPLSHPWGTQKSRT